MQFSDLAFEFELSIPSQPESSRVDDVEWVCQFRHFNNSAISFSQSEELFYLIGFRIYSDKDVLLFEDRAIVNAWIVEPNVWQDFSICFPTRLFNDEHLVLHVDFLVEDKLWLGQVNNCFARRVLTVDESGVIRAEQTNSETPTIVTEQFQPMSPLQVTSSVLAVLNADKSMSIEMNSMTQQAEVVFDVSDLVQYFLAARLPTGIQRVQIEVIDNVIFSKQVTSKIKIACFTRDADFWLEIPPQLFRNMCHLALVDGDVQAQSWQRMLKELSRHLQQADHIVFSPGSTLVNLGTSWWLQNYFLNVRIAKARNNIRYVPYVHDCIPIVTPEHCVAELTRDFISWILGVFQHADHVLVNSEATAKDICRIARFLNQPVPTYSLIPLDADFRLASLKLANNPDQKSSKILRDNKLDKEEFVLFVSTVESRKNHLLAFSAWIKLARKYPLSRVPKLVCVGNRGWLNDAVYTKIDSSTLLRDKVVMLSGVSDVDLAILYTKCLFTLYPSSYEGWGLPVTESLCYGKVPVLSRSSSLPEAGGIFAQYFDLGSENEFVQIVDSLIFDVGFRTSLETNIVENFKPRTWQAIGSQILSVLSEISLAPSHSSVPRFETQGVWAFELELGRYYAITQNRETQISRGMLAGEIYRQGTGWWWLEPWGCWTKREPGIIAASMPTFAGTGLIVWLDLQGIQQAETRVVIEIQGTPSRKVQLGRDEQRYVAVRLSPDAVQNLPSSNGMILLNIEIRSDNFADFSLLTEGRDRRVSGAGVRGFMAIREDDGFNRIAFLEAITTGDLAGLASSTPTWSEMSDVI